MMMSKPTAGDMNFQIGRVQMAKQLLDERKKRYGHRAASVTAIRNRLKAEEAKLIEMTIAYFGGTNE